MIRTKMLGRLVGLGLILGATAPGAGLAQMQMEQPTSGTETQFRRIEQPLALKMAVTLGGATLIGLELWWFLFSKTKAQQATAHAGIQEVTVTVDGGYEPSRIVVQAGQPVRLNFDRKDPSSCLEEVRFPDFHIAQDLPLNRVTPVEFVPDKPGQYEFTCGMNMFRGVVEVQAGDTTEVPSTASTTRQPLRQLNHAAASLPSTEAGVNSGGHDRD